MLFLEAFLYFLKNFLYDPPVLYVLSNYKVDLCSRFDSTMHMKKVSNM